MNDNNNAESAAANGGVDNKTPNNDPNQPADPFSNLNDLRLSQDFSAQANVRPVFTLIPVRKPNRQEFIRVRAGQEWQFETGLFKEEESSEFYMVAPTLWMEIPDEVKPTCLRMCISRNSSVPFLWPIRLPGPDGRPNRWHESAAAAARIAERDWLKVPSDMSAGCYVPVVSQAQFSEPEWPADLDMSGVLRLAFRDRFIGDVDHPVLRRLRGEV